MIMIVIFMMVIVMTMMINYYHCYTLLYFCIMSFRPNVRHTHTQKPLLSGGVTHI